MVAVGVNCTPPTFVPELIGRAGTVTSKTLVAYPNRGGTWDAATKTWTGDGVPGGGSVRSPSTCALRAHD